MKVFDCFTFFNEVDLLEFRLKLLAETVDHFVIAESNITHTGKPKEYNFLLNEERFKPWKDKIVYLPVKQSTEGLVFNEDEKKYNPENGSWQLETGQRNALAGAKELINNDDLIIIGDLDEIPDPAVIKKIYVDQTPRTLSMIFHNYFMNYRNSKAEKKWNGSVVCSGKDFKENIPQHFRDNRNKYERIKNAGWHFSYLGGIEKIKYKLQSFAHTEYNKPEYLDEKHIIDSLEKGKDILKRPGVKHKLVSLNAYPSYVRKIMLQYPQFIKEISWKKRLLNLFR